jgi:hypothetical protein
MIHCSGLVNRSRGEIEQGKTYNCGCIGSYKCDYCRKLCCKNHIFKHECVKIINREERKNGIL